MSSYTYDYPIQYKYFLVWFWLLVLIRLWTALWVLGGNYSFWIQRRGTAISPNHTMGSTPRTMNFSRTIYFSTSDSMTYFTINSRAPRAMPSHKVIKKSARVNKRSAISWFKLFLSKNHLLLLLSSLYRYRSKRLTQG